MQPQGQLDVLTRHRASVSCVVCASYSIAEIISVGNLLLVRTTYLVVLARYQYMYRTLACALRGTGTGIVFFSTSLTKCTTFTVQRVPVVSTFSFHNADSIPKTMPDRVCVLEEFQMSVGPRSVKKTSQSRTYEYGVLSHASYRIRSRLRFPVENAGDVPRTPPHPRVRLLRLAGFSRGLLLKFALFRNTCRLG